MRLLSTISAICGMFLIVMKIFGIYADAKTEIFLPVGLFLLCFSLLILLIYKKRQNKKIEDIIHSYKKKVRDNHEDLNTTTTKKPKGWSMNDSPFRKRKSGLTWGGGNIKAAEATRGTRRKFL